MVEIICEQDVVADLALSRDSAFRPGRLEFGPNDKAKVQGSADRRSSGCADGARLAKTTDLAQAWDLRSDDRQIMAKQNGRILFSSSSSLPLKLPEKI